MAKRAKKSGYSTGYNKYVQLYKERANKVKKSYDLTPMLSSKDYKLILGEMKADSLVDKRLGLISKNTSVNFNREILNEQQFGTSAKQAHAVRRGLLKYVEENNIDLKSKDIKIKDLRAINLKVGKLSSALDQFWSDVATAQNDGMDKRNVGITFFDSP